MLRVLNGEIRKQKNNYFNSWGAYVSFIIWPLLTLFSVWFSYKNHNISYLSKFGIKSETDLFTYLLTGCLEYNCFWLMVQSAFFMRNERENGTLEVIFLTPASRLGIVYGRAMGSLYQALWLGVIYGISLLAIERYVLRVTAILFILYPVTLLSAIIWGGFMNTIFLFSRDIEFWFDVSDEPMKLFSGVNVPISKLPQFFRCISAIFPLTYCLEMVRAILLQRELVLYYWCDFWE